MRSFVRRRITRESEPASFATENIVRYRAEGGGNPESLVRLRDRGAPQPRGISGVVRLEGRRGRRIRPTPDCVAVRGVWCEPVSGPVASLIGREDTGKSASSGPRTTRNLPRNAFYWPHESDFPGARTGNRTARTRISAGRSRESCDALPEGDSCGPMACRPVRRECPTGPGTERHGRRDAGEHAIECREADPSPTPDQEKQLP
jgi:hypothetical protein